MKKKNKSRFIRIVSYAFAFAYLLVYFYSISLFIYIKRGFAHDSLYHRFITYLYGNYEYDKSVEIKHKLENLSWWACEHKILLGIIVLIPIVIDVIFDIIHKEKHIIKWISYVLIVGLIAFIIFFVVLEFWNYQPV